ncbi:hypothetical protein GYA28_01360 [Candidatus Roizmanbacteria bacterium]|jgi:hypothetical protein|nr:hypothetical protein [Candidatus Roizmanbacteria bacterium]
MTTIEIKKDKYKKARGNWSRILEIYCSHCGYKLFFYQKDGPGPLKRLYEDRIAGPYNKNKIVCPNCKSLIGSLMIYKKENRRAFLLNTNSIKMKIVNSKKLVNNKKDRQRENC